MTLPSSTPWALCDRCGFGHAAGEACQRKAPPTEAYQAARREAKPTRHVPPKENAA